MLFALGVSAGDAAARTTPSPRKPHAVKKAKKAKKRLSAKQRARIRAQLRQQVRRNPRIVTSKAFLKRAGLVEFRLPVTLVLRTGDNPATSADESATNNPNRAIVDLGASLGRREVDLGGRLAAEIVFTDAYDGGALGNVKIDLLPSNTDMLDTTSIPLIWNDQIWSDSTTRWDANAVNDLINRGNQVTKPGCGDFDSSTTDLTKAIAGNLIFARGYEPVPGGPGLPGYPLNQKADGSNPAPGEQNFDPDHTNIPEGFLPQQSGIDTPTRLKADRNPGDPMALGGNPSPFPAPAGWSPGGFTQPPGVADTVFRTAPLKLKVAEPGTTVNMTGVAAQGGDPNGANGTQNIVVGKSGGQANLFGRIPGKSYGIDVTASFATRISSIIRIVDQDLTGRNLIEGEPWPAGVFGCRQVYTGFVDNYLPGVRLKGSLHIAPGITSDGHLRIAKATVSSETPARFPVAACVVPMSSFQEPNNSPGENRDDAPAGSYTEYDDNLPSPFSGGVVLQPLDPLLFPEYTGGMEPLSELPVDISKARSRPPARPCNTPADRIVQEAAMQPMTVGLMSPGLSSNGYTTSASGATITVGADLDVENVSIDVLVGDQPAPAAQQASGGLSIAGVLDPILSLLPPVLVPPIVPSLPTVPAPPPLPSTTLPSTTLPSTTLPSTTLPSTVLPSTTLPSTDLPSTTLPSTTLPSTDLPSTSLPSTTLPSTTLPSTDLPSTTLPSTTLPSTTLPSTTLPSTTLPSTTLPSTTLPGLFTAAQGGADAPVWAPRLAPARVPLSAQLPDAVVELSADSAASPA